MRLTSMGLACVLLRCKHSRVGRMNSLFDFTTLSDFSSIGVVGNNLFGKREWVNSWLLLQPVQDGPLNGRNVTV